MKLAPVSSSYLAPEPINPTHQIADFDCGQPTLTAWLKTHALSNEGKASRTYVVQTIHATPAVVGFYTLASSACALTAFPKRMRHNLPDPVPTMLLGRLAVDIRHKGRGLGSGMLQEALSRTLGISMAVGVRSLMVHAIDDAAIRFYGQFGFRAYPNDGRTMFLPIETITKTL